ncbi:MAG: formate C-acetyltransferase/glycerol dehydratase family glycyl radical enzyme [Firmicutes bacterium]|nr:formate C-acetyltransferase/glycerol dehydratase family glycyl radical enzyme [Bacillota bacterium]
MASARIEQLKQRLMSAQPCVTAERLRLATEGYRENGAEPMLLARAKTLAYVLRHMTVSIAPGELLVGNHSDRPHCAPIYPEYLSADWLLSELDQLPTRPADKLQVSPADREEIPELLSWWRGKSMQEVTAEALPERIRQAEACGLLTIGSCDGATGHTNPAYHRLLEGGLNAVIDRCRQQLDEHRGGTEFAQEQRDFWQACIIVCEAVIDHAGRYAAEARRQAERESDPVRRQELLKIADVCARVPAERPRDLHETLQFVWFIHLLLHVESNAHAIGLGRFDQYAWPFFQQDRRENGLTDEQAVELLQCLFIKCTDIIKLRGSYYSQAFAGFSMWQTIMCGGQDAEGKDASNDLSYLLLEAADGVRLPQPAVCLVCFDGTPDKLFRKGVEMVRTGQANPAFFNDKAAVPICLAKGGTLAEARQWTTVGCIEPHPGMGVSDGLPTAGYVNLLKCLELALHNGVDPISGTKLGPETGDPLSFTDLEQLKEAVKIQARYFFDLNMEGYNIVLGQHMRRTPNILASLVMDGCIEKGRSVQAGGAGHSYAGIAISAPANLADSLAAIDQLVFREGRIGMAELIRALDTDFKDAEPLRQMLLNLPPKFGNDDPRVDEIAREMVVDCAKYVQLPEHRDARGGRYTLSNVSQTLNLTQGAVTGASADGRHAFTPLADNASPHMGRDVSGPTAAVNSVAALDHAEMWNGHLYNLRFDPDSVRGDKGLDVIDGVVRTFFDRGGFHIQINVVDDATLRDAQIHPEEHRGLVVRVAGYLAFFTELDRGAQDLIIARTAHRV